MTATKNIYYAEYSHTDGLWVAAGRHETKGAARHALLGYRKAGARTRIIEAPEDHPLGYTSDLIRQGVFRVCE